MDPCNGHMPRCYPQNGLQAAQGFKTGQQYGRVGLGKKRGCRPFKAALEAENKKTRHVSGLLWLRLPKPEHQSRDYRQDVGNKAQHGRKAHSCSQDGTLVVAGYPTSPQGGPPNELDV